MSRLLTNLSHEIRTPLNAILGFADVLGEEVPDALTSYVDPIRDNGHRLLDTLNSLLELARLHAGDTRLALEELDLVAETRAAVDRVCNRLQPHHLALSVSTDAPILKGWWDCALLRSIVANLVMNAIKFTEQGSVRVHLAAEESDVVLSVADTGCGISAEFLPHLFDAFRQESDGLTRDYEGTGIGLAVSKQFVELMGGRIDVRSEVGIGTTFEIRLPRTPGGDSQETAAVYAAVPTLRVS